MRSFPTSNNGYKYVLSAICLASRFPEAIALKDVGAEAVAEGVTGSFSRTGVPRQLLTDQGSQLFCRYVSENSSVPNTILINCKLQQR